MKIPIHAMEPWLIANQQILYNLGQSGVTNQTLGKLLQTLEISPDELLPLSLEDNDTKGSPMLRQAIAEVYPTTTPENILVTTGSSEAIWLYFHIRYSPGKNVVVPVPAFQNLITVPEYLGYEVRTFSLESQDIFRPNIEKIRRLVDENTQAIVLNNPHNPTGVLFSNTEIDEIVAIAERVGAEILADEHYRFLPYEGNGLIPSLYGRSPAVVATGSMIKCMGCVGLRIGWLLAPSELLEASRDLKDYTTHTLTSMNDFLATRIINRWQTIIPGYQSWIQQNIASFENCIQNHSDTIQWIPPQAGVVAFPFLREGISSEHFVRKLIEREEVFLLPGDTFGFPGYFRICLGVEPNSFSQAMERLDRFIRWYNSSFA
ncbi:MAG: aminotransferase class I/II-fold pyridoxal phosphate-dependent enzyme [Spirochaetota bacterium]